MSKTLLTKTVNPSQIVVQGLITIEGKSDYLSFH